MLCYHRVDHLILKGVVRAFPEKLLTRVRTIHLHANVSNDAEASYCQNTANNIYIYIAILSTSNFTTH